MQHRLQQQGWFDNDQINAYCQTQRSAILQALKTAEIQPKLDVREIVTDVYHDIPWHLVQQRDELVSHIQRHPEYYPHISTSDKD